MQELQVLANDMRQNHLAGMIGKEQSVLWESKKQDTEQGLWLFSGYTPNFTRVHTQSDRDLSGTLLKTQLKAVNHELSAINGHIEQQLIANLRPPIEIKRL